jgi:hypothetical protein
MRAFLNYFVRAGAIAWVVGLVACSPDATAPAPDPFVEGLAFNYAGGLSGTFEASGEPEGDAIKEWAGAWQIEGTPLLIVAAILPRSASTHDAVAILIPRVTPGTATISNICPPEGCADLLATFGRPNEAPGDFLQGCHLVTGTVTIASIDAARVTGSFTGTGTCFSTTGDELTTFSVTNGKFDLPMIDQ